MREEDPLIGHPDGVVSVRQVLPLHLHGRVFGHVHALHQLVLSRREEMRWRPRLEEAELLTGSVFSSLRSLTSGASDLHTGALLSSVGDVTLILRTSSGDGKAGGKGERERGVRDWGDSRVGDGGSKFRLCAESVRLWPLFRCV